MKLMKKVIFFFLYLTGCAIFILACLEGAVRILSLAPALPSRYESGGETLLPWKYEANSHMQGWSAKKEFWMDHKHNSLGFRDTEHTFEKPQGTYRIVGIGDSFTYGIGAKFEETYLYQLESMLNARQGDHPKVEIIKLGIERYWPEPERLVLEHYGLKYNPDLVLVGFVPNDIYDTAIGLKGLSVSKGYLVYHEANRIAGPWLIWGIEKSHIVRILLNYYKGIKKAEKVEFKPIDDPVYRKEWEIVKKEYAGMIKMSEKAGVKFSIVSIPQWSSQNTASKELNDFCTGSGCMFIDILPTFLKEADISSLYYPVDGHCTVKGYKLIATAIFNHLTKEGIVP